jgi:two-component system response regulator FixJ
LSASPPPLSPRTVYIVDDDIDFLGSAEWWLRAAGFEVQGFAHPRDALRTLYRPSHGACLLLDVQLPYMSGLQVHRALLARGVDLPVVYMTGHGEVPTAVQAMRLGAVTFIEKPFADDVLESALALAFGRNAGGTACRVARESGAALPPASAPCEAERVFAERLARLTRREREVIDWVVQGKLNKVIADLLGISIKTVELHRKNAMRKLKARSAIDLMRLMVTGRVEI